MTGKPPGTSARGAFIGRARELRALGERIDAGARLVTITGAAGIGKTRLVLEWAASALAARDGARLLFCDLSEAKGLDDACAVLARALDVPLSAGGTADEVVAQLGRALAEPPRSVVLLDNLEQLVDVAPQMLGPWLSYAPRALFVVTSRERLRLDGEVSLGLEPLGVPPADERSLQAIASADAVELFVARARAVRFDFELTEAEAENVAAIVRRVDGIPLAIELCAARMGVLAPGQILDRLARRFELLVTGARGAPARKATLRGAIDSSWELLAPWEKDALAQCSVFTGGFSLEAAEAVLELGAGCEGRSPPILDVLQSLHDKSLIRAFDLQGERRYGLLESLREYAAERLDELGGKEAAARRHAAYFLGMEGSRDAPFPRVIDVRRASLEASNLIAVCTRALARRPLTPEDAEAALRGLLLLEPVLLLCAKGRLEPYVAMLDAALEAASAPPGLRTRALYTRALADLLRGRVLDSFLGFQRALDEARAAGSRADESLALTKLGLMFDQAERPDDARSCFDQARAIALDLGEASLHADWMLTYGGALNWRGRATEAVGYVEQAAAGFQVAGDPRGQSLALSQIALARLSLGRLDEAELAAGQTLALLQEDRRTEGYVLGILGRIQQARGRFGEAREKLGAALAIHRAVGDRWSEGVLHGYLGDVAFEEGLLDDARSAYGEALARLHGTGERHYSIVFLAALGAVETGLGHEDAAARHFEAAAERLGGGRVLTTRIAVELHSAHADAWRARVALAAGDETAAARYRLAAAAPIAVAQAPAPDGTFAPARGSEDVRFAVRLLERAIALPATSASPPGDPLPPAIARLVVGPEARWFRLQDSRPVPFLKAKAARLVLAFLVRARIDAPGRALSLAELFEAGWPGERISPKAAANRVYVTLTKLRKLGLGALLQSRDDGFLLDPTAVVLESLAFELPPA
ncbi:AAA family ATPase [Polyangium jinanense]|uniref:AAA family ATPase n=1 Tax=Polyangium jinanense TaxID=2829994 RepID=A0A9X3XGQ7_9BACT|nr:AAA family ATPase [Polyangium jinanense]MDC3962067.1 AAA family ATPase [Polyangium jinanense]MDC3988783.1 AAA family ATPase [Polyangium jinanense]